MTIVDLIKHKFLGINVKIYQPQYIEGKQIGSQLIASGVVEEVVVELDVFHGDPVGLKIDGFDYYLDSDTEIEEC
jgi:hypothetical protein